MYYNNLRMLMLLHLYIMLEGFMLYYMRLYFLDCSLLRMHMLGSVWWTYMVIVRWWILLIVRLMINHFGLDNNTRRCINWMIGKNWLLDWLRYLVRGLLSSPRCCHSKNMVRDIVILVQTCYVRVVHGYPMRPMLHKEQFTWDGRVFTNSPKYCRRLITWHTDDNRLTARTSDNCRCIRHWQCTPSYNNKLDHRYSIVCKCICTTKLDCQPISITNCE